MAGTSTAGPLSVLPDELWLKVFSELDPWQRRAPVLHNHLHMSGFDRQRPLGLWAFWIAHEEELKLSTRSLMLKLSCVCKMWRSVLSASPLFRATPWLALHSPPRPEDLSDAYYRFMSTSALAATHTLYLLNRGLSNCTMDHLALNMGGKDSSVRALLLKSYAPSGHHAVVTLAAAFPNLKHLILDMDRSPLPAGPLAASSSASTSVSASASTSASASGSVAFCSSSLTAAAHSLRQLQSVRIYCAASEPPNISSGLLDLLSSNPDVELLHIDALPLDNMPAVAVTLSLRCQKLQTLNIPLGANCYLRSDISNLLASLPRLKAARFLVSGAAGAGINLDIEQRALSCETRAELSMSSTRVLIEL